MSENATVLVMSVYLPDYNFLTKLEPFQKVCMSQFILNQLVISCKTNLPGVKNDPIACHLD